MKPTFSRTAWLSSLLPVLMAIWMVLPAREATAQSVQDPARQEMQRELDKQEAIRFQRNLLLCIAVLLFCSLLFLVGILRSLRIKNRHNKLIAEGSELFRAQSEELKRLAVMKSQFFANISHEFRTPLTLILGQIDSVIPNIEDQKLQEKLKMAFRNGKGLLMLINHILDLSRIEAGGMQLRSVYADLIPFLKNIFYSFETLAEQKQIRMVFESVAPSHMAYFEAEQLEKVFLNLLSNAFKFTDQGGTITMVVAMDREGRLPKSLEPGILSISVRDTGVGISPERLPFIFNRFFHVKSPLSGEQGGTGLGLALVKEITDLHDGEVRVQSEEGGGTEFSVLLPLGKKHLSGQGPFNASAPKADFSFSPMDIPGYGVAPVAAMPSENATGKGQILIVEDHPDVRYYLREHLLDAGYEVAEAAQGEEGIVLASSLLPDLILTDVVMPKMNGYEFSARLRSLEKTSHIPIVMLTARAAEEDKMNGLAAGIDAYLTKPFSSRELLLVVENLINLRALLRKKFSAATIIQPSEVSANPADQIFLKKVIATIEANMGNEQFGVETLAEAVLMSSTHLNRKLNALIDQSAGHLIRSMRLQRAADLLVNNTANIAEIAYQVGFTEPANFSRSFKKQFGVAPSEYSAPNMRQVRNG